MEPDIAARAIGIQPEPVGVAGRKVADVQTDRAEARDLSHLSFREEPIGDSALIEDLDCP